MAIDIQTISGKRVEVAIDGWDAHVLVEGRSGRITQVASTAPAVGYAHARSPFPDLAAVGATHVVFVSDDTGSGRFQIALAEDHAAALNAAMAAGDVEAPTGDDAARAANTCSLSPCRLALVWETSTTIYHLREICIDGDFGVILPDSAAIDVSRAPHQMLQDALARHHLPALRGPSNIVVDLDQAAWNELAAAA